MSNPSKPQPNHSSGCFSEDYPTHIEGIVYDQLDRQYYNCKSDIYLSDDDIVFHKLRPLEQITTPLPNPLPENYWVAPA